MIIPVDRGVEAISVPEDKKNSVILWRKTSIAGEIRYSTDDSHHIHSRNYINILLLQGDDIIR